MILVFTTPPIFPFLAAIGTRLFRKKLIVVCYDLYPQLALDFAGMKRGGFTERLMVWMNRFTYRTAARIVVLSEEMKKELLSAYPTWSRKIEIIPNWQDEKDFPSYQLEPQINDQKRPFTVAYTGNMGICQDMDTILKAAGLLKNRDIRFILAGHGVKAGVLQEKAQSQRLNMEFQGFLTGKAYTALLKQADCQLLSIRNGVERYSAPSKTYSYLAAGKPIIAILKPSCALARELSEKGAAFIVREGDVNGVADAILKLSRNPQLAKKMGENARKLFEERYTRTINTEKYATMLFEIKKEGDEKAC